MRKLKKLSHSCVVFDNVCLNVTELFNYVFPPECSSEIFFYQI
ncbi:hypothetical protein AGR7C_Cc110218 [Agrobacterium deltaense Zutra 3/1]|uniref:Uncharacterized protein n=1 Tax=Agrobacterium deltaense Zutra 3/1 TaxID=1183427 RepID=A0A1S7P204_9HYPH|nr:hypothetical protein AGR7C_Cc110218 [Agrobacterium deltaense Zutra 3/1]